MHMIRSPRTYALAGVTALVALLSPQAAAQATSAHVLPAAQHRAPVASTPWLRAALAKAKSHKVKPKVPIGNFASCPKLPTGDDPTQFTCFLVHITGGVLTIGHSTVIISSPINVAFAEGLNPQGVEVAIFGSLKGQPIPVPGGIFLNPAVSSLTTSDPNLQLTVQPVGVGVKPDDTGNTLAFIAMKVKAGNPLFGSTCFVGSKTDPIVTDPTFNTTSPPPPNQPISGHVDSAQIIGNEIVIIGTVVDNAFAAPAAGGCGPSDALSQVVNEVGALPSAAGTNTAIFQITAEATSYTSLPS
jgi:hypothetical protein